MAALLDNVPQSRTFDEMIKLLQTGHALASIVELKKQGLHRGVFPVLDVALDEAHRHDGREKFVQLALADTDRRYLQFGAAFEARLVTQDRARSLEESMAIGWSLLAELPTRELTRLSDAQIAAHLAVPA